MDHLPARLFRSAIDDLLAAAKETVERRPDDFRKSGAFKRLAAVATVAFGVIPANLADPKYCQGGTLGRDRKHWFRVKFFQQYRLFFRYSEVDRVIVYAWVNKDCTQRARGSRRNAYATFAKMLEGGDPPNDWNALLCGGDGRR